MCECSAASQPPRHLGQSGRNREANTFKMVNKYKRKTSNASWDEAVMKCAMEETGKDSVNAAAKNYMPASMTDRPEPLTKNETESLANVPEISVADNEHHVETSLPCDANIRSSFDSDRTVSPSILNQNVDNNLPMEENEPQPFNEPINSRNTPTPVVQSFDKPLTPCNTLAEDTGLQPEKQHMTPLNIRPLPQMIPQKTTRRRKPQKAEILTSTPIKDQQREKENKKKVSKTKIDVIKKKPKRGRKGKNEETEYSCLVVSELYVQPPIEDWIRCDDCQMWTHEACTGYSGRGSYYCDACQE